MAGPGFTQLFGGSTIYPSQASFLSLNPLTANVVLQWPFEQQFSSPALADIVEVSASTGGLSVSLSDARQTTTGYTALFNNIGANTFTVKDSTGATIASVASGTVWQVYLADNSTQAGVWRVFQYGAGASSANAAALAGAGLVAISTTLNEQMAVTQINTPYVSTNADRAKAYEWTGGTGSFTLPDPTVVGTNWFVILKNNGNGNVTVTSPSGTLDQTSSLTFAPDESAFLVTDGTNWFTIGFGQQVNAIFDFIQIDVSGTGDFVLTGAQLNRISYRFTGVLTGARNIIVPNTIQQYWVDNETTGAFALTVKTAAGTGTIVGQGNRSILYCDGTNVVLAQTSGAITFANGSAPSPSVTFTSDQTTGLFFVAPHTLGVATNGIQRLQIDAAGHWLVAAATDNTAPTIDSIANNGGIAGRFGGPFGAASANPYLVVQSTAAGGFSVMSIVANNGTPGTNDLSLFQNGSTLAASIFNRAAASLSLGTSNTAHFTMDLNGSITLGVTGSNIALAIPGAPGAVTSLQVTSGTGGGLAALFGSATSANAAIGINNSATTGAQTATFAATNKPGSGTTAPDKWIPITLDGSTHYVPAWL